MESSVDLESLVLAAGDGDRDAVAELLAALQPRVIRYCRARIGSRHSTYASADDVAQEVLLAALTSLSSYRDRGNGFGAFVFGIAAHKVADFHRKRTREHTTPVADVWDSADDSGNDSAGPEQAVLRAELRWRVRDLLGTLSDAEQDVLVHRVVLGLSSAETAALLASTPGAVRVTQHRALGKLRRMLKARGEPS